MAISHGRSGGGRASTGMNRAAAGRAPAANLAKRAGPFTSGAKTTQYTPKAAAPKTGPTNLGGYSKPASKPAPSTGSIQSGRMDPVTRPAMTGPYKPSNPVPKTAPTNLGGYSKPAAKAAPTNQMKANAVKNRTRGR